MLQLTKQHFVQTLFHSKFEWQKYLRFYFLIVSYGCNNSWYDKYYLTARPGVVIILMLSDAVWIHTSSSACFTTPIKTKSRHSFYRNGNITKRLDYRPYSEFYTPLETSEYIIMITENQRHPLILNKPLNYGLSTVVPT